MKVESTRQDKLEYVGDLSAGAYLCGRVGSESASHNLRLLSKSTSTRGRLDGGSAGSFCDWVAWSSIHPSLEGRPALLVRTC